MDRRASKLVVGVGNVLRRDEGVGVHAVLALADQLLPPDVELFDAGTIGLEAAAVLIRREKVVILDALEAGLPPGAIRRMTPEELCPATSSRVSLHDLHILDALAETRLLGEAPRRVVVLAVQVADVSWGMGLTPAVSQAIPHLLECAADELEGQPWN